MTIAGISGGLSPAIQGNSGRFFLPGANEFADTLTVGQILKGRVLRQYDSNRYLVNFDGHERVVDSAIPLKTSEVLYGRVVGVGERVELQRVSVQASAEEEQAYLAKVVTGGELPASGSTGTLNQILAQFRVNLDAAEQATLAKVVGQSADANTAALAGVLLSKLGLAQSSVLLNAVYSVLLSKQSGSDARNLAESQALAQILTGVAALSPQAIAQVGNLLRQSLEQSLPNVEDNAARVESSAVRGDSALAVGNGSGADTADADLGSHQSRQDSIGQLLLNVQTDGSVAHRMGTVPLLVGNRLLEVEVALFEQRRSPDPKTDVRHRHLVFRLQTDTLGQVEISAKLAGNHVRVYVAAEQDGAAQSLSNQAESLRATLIEHGWQVDEISYVTQPPGDRNPAAHAVMEHVVRQDSLNWSA